MDFYKIYTKDGKVWRLVRYNDKTFEGNEVDTHRPLDNIGDNIVFNPDNIIAVKKCYGDPIWD